MEYSIGSLAELITGNKTPNKRKVVAKKIKSPSAPIKTEPEPESLPEASAPKKGKKRKFQETLEAETPPEAPTVDKKPKLERLSKHDKNAKRRVKRKEKKQRQEDPEEQARTVFVGNLPIGVNKTKVKKFFTKLGRVDTVRIRGIPVADPKTPKKVAVIKKEFHPERSSVHAYVKFETPEDALAGVQADGQVFKEHHLRVRMCSVKETPDESKAIFIGNLSFGAEEDDLWKLFQACGPISSVRIVRDPRTGMGKGFGYINFLSSDSVHLALEMQEVKFKDRELRISACNAGAAKKNKKKNKVTKIVKPGKPKLPKKAKTETNESAEATHGNVKPVDFQGSTTSDRKKKKKLNKGLIQKKKMIKKFAPKPK